MSDQRMQIEHVTPDSLRPAPYNPRTMTTEARTRLERGIKEFGLVDPIIARRSDALVIGGHQRLTAAIKLGMDTVPVVFLDDISDTQAAALNVLLNNQSASGEWDFAKLTDLLSTLDGDGFDTTLTGFSVEELTDMLGVSWDDTAKAAPDAMDDDDAALGRPIVLVAHADETPALRLALPAFLAQFPTARIK